MRSIHCSLALVAVASLAGVSLAAPSNEVESGSLEIVLSDATIGRFDAPLTYAGKLVVQGTDFAGGDLITQGASLGLREGGGELRRFEDLLVTLHEGEGSIHSVSRSSRRLFEIADLEVQLHVDNSAMIVGELRMDAIADLLGRPELEGQVVGAVIVNAQPGTVRRLPTRTNVIETRTEEPQALGSTPDVIVWDVGVDGNDTNDIHYWGQNGGIAAYSIATQSCNSGSALLDWYQNPDRRHPVIGQNMFRYADGRFEQIGQSWLKHGFCAVNEFEVGCMPCGQTNCNTLGIGCADTYWASLNDGRSGGSKAFVHATKGTNVAGSPVPTGSNTIRGRLQVAVSDIDPAQNPGAEYFIEGQYVTNDDALANSASNNASWRRVNVLAVNNINGGGATQREEPAIFAWKDQDPGVTLQTLVHDEGGIDTYFFLGSRATQVDATTWRYDYAVQNLNSDQSAGSLTIPADPGVAISNVHFHDVDYHSGDPYDGTDWADTRNATDLTWATSPFSSDKDANAIRWGTLYTFGFEADVAPSTGTVTLGLFKPAAVNELLAPGAVVPSTTCASANLTRNAGANPMSLSTGSPTINTNVAATVDLSTTGHSNALIFAFQDSLELDLGAGRTLLTDITHPAGEVLSLGAVAGPTANFNIPIPNDAGLCGFSISLQAIHFGGVVPFELSNAQDWVVGQ